MMDAAKLRQVFQLAEEQKGAISSLRREVSQLREEADALREYLAASGALEPIRFWTLMHRRKFAAACAKYGLTLDVSWNNIVDVQAVALMIGLSAGPTAMRAACVTSKTVSVAVGDVRSLCPGHVYVCGGFEGTLALNTMERFTPIIQKWEVLPPMTEARQYTCAGIIAGRIYVCGGWGGPQPVSTVERFDPDSSTWDSMPPMLIARWGASAGVVAGRLHVCGGLDESRQPLSSVERFDPSVGIWEAVPSMSEQRGWPAAGVVGGLLYVCGGRDEQREPLSSAERLDIAAGPHGTWERLAPMVEQRAGAAAAATSGRFYVCGGAFGAQMLSSAECFDPKARCWESLPAMSSHGAYVGVTAVAGCLYVFGGSDGNQCLSSAELYVPSKGAWEPLPVMNERRSGAAAAAVLG